MVLSSCIVRQRFCLLSCIFFYSACYCIFFYSQQNPVQFLMELKKNCHQLNEETTMKITSDWLLRCKQWCSWKKRTERREGKKRRKGTVTMMILTTCPTDNLMPKAGRTSHSYGCCASSCAHYTPTDLFILLSTWSLSLSLLSSFNPSCEVLPKSPVSLLHSIS